MSYVLRQDSDKICISHPLTNNTVCWLDKDGVHPAEMVGATHTHTLPQLNITVSTPIAKLANDVRLVNDSAVVISRIDTDGTLAGNSDQRISTEKAVKSYVDTSISTFSSTHPILQFPATLYSLDTQESGAIMVTPKNREDGKMTHISTDGTMNSNSDLMLSTQKATKTYVDTRLTDYTIDHFDQDGITDTFKVDTIGGRDRWVTLQNNATNSITSINTDGAFNANSDLVIPTQKAVKAYVDSKVFGEAGTIYVPHAPVVFETVGEAVDIYLQNNSGGATDKITAVDTNAFLNDNSDLIIPTQKAVKSYVDYCNGGQMGGLQRSYAINIVPNPSVTVLDQARFCYLLQPNMQGQRLSMMIPIKNFRAPVPTNFTFTPKIYVDFTDSEADKKCVFNATFRMFGNVGFSTPETSVTLEVTPAVATKLVSFGAQSIATANVEDSSMNEAFIQFWLIRPDATEDTSTFGVFVYYVVIEYEATQIDMAPQ